MKKLSTPMVPKQNRPFIVSIDFWGNEYVSFECFQTKKAVKILKELARITGRYKNTPKKKLKNKPYYKFK